MNNDFNFILKPQKQLINYINSKMYQTDTDFIQLKTIYLSFDQSKQAFLDLQLENQTINKQVRDKLCSYFLINLKKVREINHSLQTVISNSNQSFSKNVSPKKLQIAQQLEDEIYNLYKETQLSILSIANLHRSIDDIFNLLESIPINTDNSKKYSFCRLYDMLKFELSCLKNEIETHRSSNQIPKQATSKIEQIENDKLMQWILKTLDQEKVITQNFIGFSNILDKIMHQKNVISQQIYIVLDDQSDTSKDTQITGSYNKSNDMSLNETPIKKFKNFKQNSQNKNIQEGKENIPPSNLLKPIEGRRYGSEIPQKRVFVEINEDLQKIQDDEIETCMIMKCQIF